MSRLLPSTGAVTGIFEAIGFFRDPDFATKRFVEYGDIFETTLIGQRLVFIRGDEAIADLLAQGDAVEGWWPASVRQLLGSQSLANRNGSEHKARRRVVSQLFSNAALKRYTPGIVGLVDELSHELLQETKPIRLADRMRRFAFRVIATTVLGLEGSDRDVLFHDFEIWTQALFSVPIAIPGTPFTNALAARRRLLDRLREVLEQADQNRGGLDLLAGGLDEAGQPLTADDIVEQLLLLLFAGYETTASSLSCLMRACLIEPHVEPWLREELDGLEWPANGDATTAFDGLRAPRLQAVVNEVMRLTPPVGGFFRRTCRPIELANVLIPKGYVVQVALASSNRAGYSDLNEFRPERHLDGSNNPTLLPFGGGDRVCLGKALAELEIRLMVVGLLKQVQLSLAVDQDLDLQLIPSPSPKDGLKVVARHYAPDDARE
jgi:cytochrome P450